MASKVEKEASPVQTDTAIGPTFDNSVLEAPRAEEAGSQDNAWTAEPALPSPHSAHSAHSLGRSGSSLKKQKTKSNAEDLGFEQKKSVFMWGVRGSRVGA